MSDLAATPATGPTAGIDRAAIMVMLMNEEDATGILSQLAPEELRQLAARMCSLGEIDPSAIAEAISGFSRSIDNGSISAHGRVHSVKRMLTSAVGDMKADSLIRQVAPDQKEEPSAALGILRWLDPEVIADLLVDEHPQAIAVLLLQLDTDTAAAALAALPRELHTPVLHRVARLGPVSRQAITILEETIDAMIEKLHGSVPITMGGVKEAAEIINRAHRSVEKEVMPQIGKIDKVLHEFSPIPGVVEDATDIILNLKQIPIKLHAEQTKTLYLRADKPGEIKASDLEVDADVEILDPDLHIATVGEGGSLHMEMRVKQGRGYVPADKNFDGDLGVGWIPVDSVHSPVKKVNYQVEAARLGQTTDYDKLTVDVWTDGTVTARDAISLSAKLVRDHLSIFINLEEPADLSTEPERENGQPVANEHLDKSVEELELSVRSYNCLKNASIRTIRELVQKTEPEMLRTKNFGRKSLNEIKEILQSMGLGLGMRLDQPAAVDDDETDA